MYCFGWILQVAVQVLKAEVVLAVVVVPYVAAQFGVLGTRVGSFVWRGRACID